MTEPPSMTTSLTSQELRVIELIGTGYKDQAIAHRLNVSLATVRRRATSVREKLGARTRPEAVAIAVGRGLFEHPTSSSR